MMSDSLKIGSFYLRTDTHVGLFMICRAKKKGEEKECWLSVGPSAADKEVHPDPCDQ